tara:strand:- start:369 stop:581 length:213 start_codon:yes stop_codon:yes gene_type:complete
VIKIFDELKKSKATELFLFSKATIPEKYFDKFFESKSLKLVLLECNVFWYISVMIKISITFLTNIITLYD